VQLCEEWLSLQADVKQTKNRELRLQKLQGSLKQLMDKKEVMQGESVLGSRASLEKTGALTRRIEELEAQLAHQTVPPNSLDPLLNTLVFCWDVPVEVAPLKAFPHLARFFRAPGHIKALGVGQAPRHPPPFCRSLLLDTVEIVVLCCERERERFTSSPTILCGNTPATLG